MTTPGSLTLVATPIGNLGDITLRALEILKSVNVILAEDTRHSRRLLNHYAIATPLVAYHDHNEARVTPSLVERMQKGEKMALITDAGTPGISDPGFYLVRAALAAGISVTAAPGPSALLAALTLSGFPCETFVFVGFTPKKPGELAKLVETLAEEPRTTVLYVAPHQLRKVIDAIAARLPDREIAVARELTKLHEDVVRGTAAELKMKFAPTMPRGEFVLVVKGIGWRPRSRPSA
ncbi:MAG TPA: 16S rRNA (cytidine(1402)-2'-O)-methyltransferase [Candidatus Krumholzibacteria bacterium]|nr:16S rRNA (cytidine(1402)-2'-O)-methyltransferase [Candidatus Krumholzibacteria bacterium]